MYRGAVARKNECSMIGALFSLHPNSWLYGKIFHNRQDISTKHHHQGSNSFQDSPILLICFKVLNGHVSAWRCCTRGSITSIPTSVAPRLCCVCAARQSVSVCFALQIVQSSLNLCFCRTSQSLGFVRVTVVLQDSAASVLSTCQELEKVA